MDYPKQKQKSRDQKFFEFFIILQKEYIVAEIRKKIYLDVAGRKKSEEIMEGKKKKIFDIAMKNNLKTIFPDMKLGTVSLYDENLRISLYREIYGEVGMPNFIYRDESQYEALSQKDKRCYYSIGSEVKLGGKVGTIHSVDLENDNCILNIEGELISTSIQGVTRIL